MNTTGAAISTASAGGAIPSTGGDASAKDWMWLGVVTAMAALLRCWHMAARPFWSDEVTTLITARRALRDSFLTVQDPQPPLYQLLLRLGDLSGSPSEWTLRWPSALAGVLLIPTAWWLARLLSGRALAAVMILLLACNPLLVHYSREARPYALFVLLSTLSMVLLVMLLRSARLWVAGAFAVTTAALFYTHYYAVFLVAGQLAFVVTYFLLDRRAGRGWFWRVVLAYVAALVLALPGLWLFFRLVRMGMPGAWWIARPSLVDGFDSMGDLLGMRTLGPLCVIPLVAAIWLTHTVWDAQRPMQSWWKRRRHAVFCTFWVAASLFLPLLGSIVYKPGFVLRYTLPVAVPLTLLGLMYLERASRVVLVGLVMALLAFTAPKAIGQSRREPGLRDIASFLNQRRAGRPVVLVDWPFAADFINPERLGLQIYGYSGPDPMLISVHALEGKPTPAPSDLVPAGRALAVAFGSTVNPLRDYLIAHGRPFTIKTFGWTNLVEIEPEPVR